jgi:hypothetical protein
MPGSQARDRGRRTSASEIDLAAIRHRRDHQLAEFDDRRLEIRISLDDEVAIYFESKDDSTRTYLSIRAREYFLDPRTE